MNDQSPPRGNRAPPEQVRMMFDRIAPVYDGMNAAISGFQEQRWRRRVVRAAELRPGMHALDVACGTGKVSADLLARVSPDGGVLGVDFSPGMIERARSTFADRAGLRFVVGDALALPVEDETFDAATIAFGMRNLPDYGKGFAEMRRAVRPGGRVICLEIARPRTRLGRAVQAWFDRVVPIIGRLVGQGDAYAYLVQSTKGYPAPERIAAIMVEEGLERVRWAPLSGGIVTLHVGVRPRDGDMGGDTGDDAAGGATLAR
jgi:demethylmenaquinone methyltransferase / 2-methoxy-6-polyprenyl-1,4-benzoquinol methylase